MKHSSSNIAISVRGLSKEYTITHQETSKHSTLTETFIHRLRHPFRREPHETFSALNDLNFDVHQGDVIGIIGRNGAGKSTLLKILSRITEPTSGEVNLYGRIGSLLEVGTGFHPELTGRENIFLNGAILGMHRTEIRKQFDAIVDFSGCERFLDTPVKRYSSGMYVRLAFAVAAHLESEILVVDEVLAVGDAEFQRKCLGKMKNVAAGGRTVLFVSHHMQSISVLCSKAMFLNGGQCEYIGSVDDAIECYVRSYDAPAKQGELQSTQRPGTGELRVHSISASQEYFTCAEEKIIRFAIRREKPFEGVFFVTFHILDERGAVLLHCDSRMINFWPTVEDNFCGEFRLKSPWLKPGRYRLDFFVCNAGILDRFEDACQLNVIPLLPYPAAANEEATQHGSVFADFTFATLG